MKIAVLGSNGFVGSTIYKILKQEEEHYITGITIDNYNHHIGEEFHVLINANGNSRKYLAEQDPKKDFRLSVLSVYNSLFDFKFGRYIYISSVDVWEDNVYGYHKKLAEQLIEDNVESYILVRCAAIIGREMKKGVLYDILNKQPLYITHNSRMQFITDVEIVKQLKRYLDSKHRYALLSSHDSIEISEIYRMLNIEPIDCRPDAKHVDYHRLGVDFESYCRDHINAVI